MDHKNKLDLDFSQMKTLWLLVYFQGQQIEGHSTSQFIGIEKVEN